MARGERKTQTRLPDADPIFGNRQLTTLINHVMVSGKKSLAQKHVYRALSIAAEKTEKTPIQVFEMAIAQITPKMEVRSRRIGGASYLVPAPMRGSRGFSLATHWLVHEARKRPNSQYHTFADKLAAELIDATKGAGGAVQKKLTIHKQAEANKAFAHFRW